MKTIYLKASTKAVLIADIAQVVTIETIEGEAPYNGEVEFSDGTIYGHYIGDVMLTPPFLNDKMEVITPATYAGAQHANLLAPDDFDTSVFNCIVTAPTHPAHQFA